MKKILLLLALPFCVNAWDKVPGYSENVYVTDGKLVETTGGLKRNIEIAHVPSLKAFAVSFYNYKDKGDQAFIPEGTISFRGCGAKAFATIKDESLIFSYKDYPNFLKMTCGEQIYARVYDSFQNYATYRFENINELRKR